MTEQRAKRWIRPAPAAKKIGVSLATFWRYARFNPDFPKVVKLSAHVSVIDDDALDAFVLSRQSKS